MHPDAPYWDRGVANVPDMTGARHLLDARDLKTICEGFGLTIPLPNVLDIGCGTGRLARLCAGYHGVDIAPSAVDYCRARGIQADVISGPGDLPAGPFDLVTAISVCTHINREDRQALLIAIRARTTRVLVDIIPGDGSGDVSVWTAVPEEFEADLRAAGFDVIDVVNYQWDMHVHRYAYARTS